MPSIRFCRGNIIPHSTADHSHPVIDGPRRHAAKGSEIPLLPLGRPVLEGEQAWRGRCQIDVIDPERTFGCRHLPALANGQVSPSKHEIGSDRRSSGKTEGDVATPGLDV